MNVYNHQIPVANPLAAYLARKTEIDSAIHRVLHSGWYILGPEVEAFEAEFAAFLKIRHVLGVGNGTDALEIALRAVDACGVERSLGAVHLRKGVGGLQVDVVPVGGVQFEEDVVNGNVVL